MRKNCIAICWYENSMYVVYVPTSISAIYRVFYPRPCFLLLSVFRIYILFFPRKLTAESVNDDNNNNVMWVYQ